MGFLFVGDLDGRNLATSFVKSFSFWVIVNIVGNRYPLGLSLAFPSSAARSDSINASHLAISGSGSYFGLFLARILDGVR